MKCKECGGKGKIKEYVCGEWLGNYVTCGFCHGKGEVVQTNEEWFCGLPTEEKAVVIMNIRNLAVYKEQIVEWLKEKHT